MAASPPVLVAGTYTVSDGFLIEAAGVNDDLGGAAGGVNIQSISLSTNAEGTDKIISFTIAQN